MTATASTRRNDKTPASPSVSPSIAEDRRANAVREVLVHAARIQLASITAASRFFAGWAQSAERYTQALSDELLDRVHGETAPSELIGRLASVSSLHLRELGLSVGRFKTGTPCRINGRSIDFSQCEIQLGDEPPPRFSFDPEAGNDGDLFTLNRTIGGTFHVEQIPCWLTQTTPKTHDIIRANLHKSPLYAGRIKGTGPRYCPSIEDKIVKFAEKEQHQIFLEPEGIETDEIYVNGFSTCLPFEVQVDLVRTIIGCENAEIIRPAYAVEYDFSYPTQLFPSLETKICQNLFLAGQINGTSGYEEAAAQGLIAGFNAAFSASGSDPMVLDRADAYIGVLVDDLVTRGTSEPYRMFTSRAEYRLTLRADNADQRLTAKGAALGVVGSRRAAAFGEKATGLAQARATAAALTLTPAEAARAGLPVKADGQRRNLTELLAYPSIAFADLARIWPQIAGWSPAVREQVEIDAAYAGYLDRQAADVAAFRRDEDLMLPAALDYATVGGLSNEAREKLSAVRPLTLGQAARIEGVTPGALTALLAHVRRRAA